MSRLQANQPPPQALLFPEVENLTAIPARTSQGKTGRVKVSSVVPTGPRLAEMLTAGALCRDQVKRVVETAASQRLVVMAILDKPKVRASSISRKDTEMKPAQSIVLRAAKEQLFFFALAAVSLLGVGSAIAFAKDRPAYFLPEERRIIENYYRSGGPSKGLPPGLAKRGGKLPPGLQKHLDKNGTLPPGLQKRLQPLPTDLDGRLPRLPDYWERVILERNVILLDRRSNRILDILENVIGLATGQ